jgi:hypothetical protein
LALLVLVASTSCTVSGGVGDGAHVTTTAQAGEPTSVGDPEALAVADLAAHSGVDPADINVIAHDQVTWRDGSLGCPKPGYSYTQMVVDGYRIVLRARAEEYQYHGADRQKPFRCSQPDPNGTVDGSAAQ